VHSEATGISISDVEANSGSLKEEDNTGHVREWGGARMYVFAIAHYVSSWARARRRSH
jgi:hypothetical protein